MTREKHVIHLLGMSSNEKVCQEKIVGPIGALKAFPFTFGK